MPKIPASCKKVGKINLNHMDPVTVKKFETKSHETPDEIRQPDKTKVEIVRLEGFTIGRLNMKPGWRWSQCIKPVVHTDSCQLSHVGYAVSGTLTVRMNDGTQKTIKGGESYTIPPGHDAWVEGSEDFVGIEVLSADQFAKT
ncbi:cupin domain-containing protein [Ilyomonas limi]|nr:cupin domain-containing protein [Ilyomonas limi]